MRTPLAIALGLAMLVGCSEEPSTPDEGEVVTPPFEVTGDAEGLLLVWFDERGPHVARRRSDIPEARRSMVRVDDLSPDSSEALDPDYVYVADLSRESGGGYVVRRMPRAAFEAAVEEAMRGGRDEGESVAARDGPADVILYGASWCGACRSAAAFLRQNGVAFVERDIEREPGAREAMQRAARAAGVSPTGIPVIDFRGEIITGFDRAALARAIERSRSTI